ncbi:uncharacterized protein LOC130777148 [Actinidia eriantha]|uniref:uncharacterized protein LOC130777148 n=1 Tax=Actinidia eriantha TaxID=165200 RepID=UPI00258A884B|nr:uncharacterized protein LOC130777148 [Actinidia eriantha]
MSSIFGFLPSLQPSLETGTEARPGEKQFVFPLSIKKRRYTAITPFSSQKSSEELLVVVGGGAAGIYEAIRAKTIAPNLNVVVIEKGKPLSERESSIHKSGSPGLKFEVLRLQVDRWILGDICRSTRSTGAREIFILRRLCQTQASIINSNWIILPQQNKPHVSLQTGKVVTTASVTAGGKIHMKIEKRTIDYVEYVEANYLLVASGSSRQGYSLATQVSHSIVEPVPSLFSFKIEDPQLAKLSEVTFPKVKSKFKLESVGRSIPHLTQVGPMLVTHWGLSGPVVLRLSAWGARDLFSSDYKGMLYVDFIPDIHIEDVKSILIAHKN